MKQDISESDNMPSGIEEYPYSSNWNEGSILLNDSTKSFKSILSTRPITRRESGNFSRILVSSRELNKSMKEEIDSSSWRLHRREEVAEFDRQIRKTINHIRQSAVQPTLKTKELFPRVRKIILEKRKENIELSGENFVPFREIQNLLGSWKENPQKLRSTVEETVLLCRFHERVKEILVSMGNLVEEVDSLLVSLITESVISSKARSSEEIGSLLSLYMQNSTTLRDKVRDTMVLHRIKEVLKALNCKEVEEIAQRIKQSMLERYGEIHDPGDPEEFFREVKDILLFYEIKEEFDGQIRNVIGRMDLTPDKLENLLAQIKDIIVPGRKESRSSCNVMKILLGEWVGDSMKRREMIKDALVELYATPGFSEKYLFEKVRETLRFLPWNAPSSRVQKEVQDIIIEQRSGRDVHFHMGELAVDWMMEPSQIRHDVTEAMVERNRRKRQHKDFRRKIREVLRRPSELHPSILSDTNLQELALQIENLLLDGDFRPWEKIEDILFSHSLRQKVSLLQEKERKKNIADRLNQKIKRELGKRVSVLTSHIPENKILTDLRNIVIALWEETKGERKDGTVDIISSNIRKINERERLRTRVREISKGPLPIQGVENLLIAWDTQPEKRNISIKRAWKILMEEYRHSSNRGNSTIFINS